MNFFLFELSELPDLFVMIRVRVHSDPGSEDYKINFTVFNLEDISWTIRVAADRDDR